MRIKLLTAVAATALLGATAAVGQTVPETNPQTQPAEAAADAATAQAAPAAANNVIDVLKSNGQFTTLLTALDQAQLTDTLASRPAVTVFAPTDAAFAALPEAERTRLLDPANAQELRNLLLYHVVVAELTTDQITGARGPVPSAGGAELVIDGSGDGIKVGTATVVSAELDASNGGVFPIDKVLNPSATAQGDGEATSAAPAAPSTEAAPASPTGPATGVNAPSGQPAAAVSTTASPPVQNPTDGQVDDEEDPANPAPTPN
jgi:uncharacterized surface protein with fasciclin (FAS1) repeats